MLTLGVLSLFLVILGIAGLSLTFKYRIAPAILLSSTATFLILISCVYHSFKYGGIRRFILSTSYICIS